MQKLGRALASFLGEKRPLVIASWFLAVLVAALVAVAPVTARAQSVDSPVGVWSGWVQYERSDGGDPIRFNPSMTLGADGTVQVGAGEYGRWRRDGEYLEIRYIGAAGARIQFSGRFDGRTYRGAAIAYNPGNNRYFEGNFEMIR